MQNTEWKGLQLILLLWCSRTCSGSSAPSRTPVSSWDAAGRNLLTMAGVSLAQAWGAEDNRNHWWQPEPASSRLGGGKRRQKPSRERLSSPMTVCSAGWQRGFLPAAPACRSQMARPGGGSLWSFLEVTPHLKKGSLSTALLRLYRSLKWHPSHL